VVPWQTVNFIYVFPNLVVRSLFNKILGISMLNNVKWLLKLRLSVLIEECRAGVFLGGLVGIVLFEKAKRMILR
jgi:hypothetical protein